MEVRICTCLLAFAAALPVSCESTEGEVRVVKVPRSALFIFGPGTREAAELNDAFEQITGGDKVTLELAFPGQSGQILRSGPIVVRKGSLTVRTAEGAFKILPDGRVIARMKGLPEKEFVFDDPPCFFLMTSAAHRGQREIVSVTLYLGHTGLPELQTTSAGMEDEKYHPQRLDNRHQNPWHVRMTIEASPDFEGSVAGWHVGTVGK